MTNIQKHIQSHILRQARCLKIIENSVLFVGKKGVAGAQPVMLSVFIPNQMEGGSHMPHGNQNDYLSGTEYRIYLKPDCKFKFLLCLEIQGKL